MSGIEIKRLPYSKATQDLFDMANEMREGMNNAFKAQFRGAIAPTQNQLMRHERQMKENLRGVMEKILERLSFEPGGVMYLGIAERDKS